MKKFICITALVFIFMLVGCTSENPNTSENSNTSGLFSQPHHQDDYQTDSSEVIKTTFVGGMGCSDQSCTDASHHHDCPPDCTDYDHFHNCDLDCTETNHHHNSQTVGGDHGEHHDDSHHN